MIYLLSSGNIFKEKMLLRSSEEGEIDIERNISDGEITISAYDTAWVALIDAGDKTPAFPSAVKWIADNQLPDGSWGDAHLFNYHDRLINTLACIVALRSWNLCPHQCNKVG
ncbi:hypothetical protein Rs2_45024 [Raphanus sativus]|nr:hypothetical protein Rs2_45024 [Raphanus sativus]